MNREHLRKRVEEQTARDNTRMRHWSKKREDRVLKTMNEPFAAKVGRIGAIGLILSDVLVISMDVLNGLRHNLPSMRMLHNASRSALMCWALFSILLIPACVVQLRRGFDDPYYEKRRYGGRGQLRMEPARKCRIWLIVSVVGLVLLSILTKWVG